MLSVGCAVGCGGGSGNTTPPTGCGSAECTGTAGATTGTGGTTGAAGTTTGTGGETTGTRGATPGTGGAMTGSGGTAGTTGAAGSGTPTGDAAGATGTAGTGAAGAGGTTGVAGAGSIEQVDFTTPGPSMGCGQTPDLTGTKSTYSQGGVNMTIYQKAVSFTNASGTALMGEYYISLPDNYAMGTPYKISYGMGGYTRSGIDCLYGDCWGLGAAGHMSGAITVFMTQIHPGNLHTPPNPNDGKTVYVSTGWELGSELTDNLAFFKALQAEVNSKYCVDLKHVFVAGGSSGGDMAHYMGCWLGDQLRGIASVGGCMPNTIAPAAGTSPEPTPPRGTESYANICLKQLDFSQCKGSVAVLMVHGFEDPHIPWADARTTHDKGWMPKNGCMTTNTPNLDTIHTTISAGTTIVPPPGMWNTPVASNRNKIMCGDADGCAADYPVRWCEHSYPGYDNSTHGWPDADIGNAFGAGKNIWDFWNSLK